MPSSDSPGEIGIGETLAGGFADKGIDPVQRVDQAVAFVQAVGELVYIALQVLDAELVLYPVEAALQDHPRSGEDHHGGRHKALCKGKLG